MFRQPSVRRTMIAVAALLAAFSMARADELTDKVDRLFARWDTTVTPGAQLIVIKDGRVVYERGYGMADLEQNVVMTPATIIMMNSTSKQFTAAAIAILAREGKLSLDDDIRKYLPELPVVARTVTIQHMIHHTSGLRDYTELLPLMGFEADADCPTVEETMELLSRQKKLNFLPGERYEYSNTGYFLLGRIVERASGQSLNDFVQEHIFRPLGMTHSHIHTDHNMIVRNRAHAYSPRKSGGFRIDMTNWEQTGDGGVFTNVEDLFFWDQAFYNEKLGAGLAAELQTQGLLNDGRQNGYAFGLRIGEYRGLRTVGHSGSWVGFRSAVLRFPEQRFSVICLANVSTLGPMERCHEVADIYLADAFKAPAVGPAPAKPAYMSLPAGELEAKAGNYREERRGTWIRLAAKDGGLALDEGGDAILLRPVGPASFMADPAVSDLTLEFGGGGPKAPLKVKLVSGGEESSFIKALPVPRLTPAKLAEYAGAYYSPELDMVYRLEVRGGELFVKYRNSSKSPMQAMAPDRFALDGVSFDFTMKRGVRGFAMSTPSIMDIEFIRR